MTDRLDSLLVRYSITTHRRSRRLLQTHVVEVNGQRVINGSFSCSTETDIVTIDGKRIFFPEEIYIMVNKPKGCVCSRKDEGLYKTVFDFIPEELHDPEGLTPLHCAGRLDQDTEGLVLLTTDGMLSHRISEPEFQKKKTYIIGLESEVPEHRQTEWTEKCSRGFFIPREGKEKSFTCMPSELQWTDSLHCKLTVCEGKFHQVKRMIAELGNKVMELKRVSLGNLVLDPELEPGCWKRISQEDIM